MIFVLLSPQSRPVLTLKKLLLLSVSPQEGFLGCELEAMLSSCQQDSVLLPFRSASAEALCGTKTCFASDTRAVVHPEEIPVSATVGVTVMLVCWESLIVTPLPSPPSSHFFIWAELLSSDYLSPPFPHRITFSPSSFLHPVLMSSSRHNLFSIPDSLSSNTAAFLPHPSKIHVSKYEKT